MIVIPEPVAPVNSEESPGADLPEAVEKLAAEIIETNIRHEESVRILPMRTTCSVTFIAKLDRDEFMELLENWI